MSDSPHSSPVHSGSSSDDENHIRSTNFNNNLDSEPEGEDLLDNQQNDYNAIPQLDRYEATDADSEEYENKSAEQRIAAELENRRRNQLNGGPADLSWDINDDITFAQRRAKQHRHIDETDPLK